MEKNEITQTDKSVGVGRSPKFWLLWILMGLVLFGLICFVIISKAPKTQVYELYETVNEANVFLLPVTQDLSTTGTVQVWMTTDTPVLFSRLELMFDKAVVKLIEDVTFVNTVLKPFYSTTQQIQYITPADVNNTGKIVFVLQSDSINPSQGILPSGTFQLATLKFVPNTTQQNIETTIGINTAGIQVVDIDASELTPIGTGATLVVNTTKTTGSTGTVTPVRMLTSTRTPTLTSVDNTVTVYAAGTSCKGMYPTMRLLLKDKIAAEWKDVNGLPFFRRFNKYIFHTSQQVNPDDVKVEFSNDDNCRDGWWSRRKLRIDKIYVNGQSVESGVENNKSE